jgi:murein L,D-transpeptidase YcbB/YkuD
LAADGIIGQRTFDALNTPLARRVEQIELALERWRWLPQRIDEDVIVVNVPAFRLVCFEIGEGEQGPSLAMDVIVGAEFPDRQTPIFAEKMTYLDFSPYWNVPRSIAVRSLIPAIESDPAELDRRDLEIVPHFGAAAQPVAPTPENIARLRAGELQLRQRPGPNNALGLVKFIMPNAHHVYLHSTPQKSLFARSRRTFSSGCIRVKNPVDLAEYVLKSQEGWTRDAIVQAMNAGRPQRVVLDEPHWVFLLYATVTVAPDGRLRFFEDIYGHDRTLADKLAGGYPYVR